MEMALIIIFIVLVGGIIVNAFATHREGATESSKMITIGLYDIIAGGAMLFYSIQELEYYMTKEEETIITCLKYMGILFLVLGAIQLIVPLFANSMKQMISDEADAKVREQRRKEKRIEERARTNANEPFYSKTVEQNENKTYNIGTWICSSCGAENEGVSSICEKCGMYR